MTKDPKDTLQPMPAESKESEHAGPQHHATDQNVAEHKTEQMAEKMPEENTENSIVNTLEEKSAETTSSTQPSDIPIITPIHFVAPAQDEGKESAHTQAETSSQSVGSSSATAPEALLEMQAEAPQATEQIAGKTTGQVTEQATEQATEQVTGQATGQATEQAAGQTAEQAAPAPAMGFAAKAFAHMSKIAPLYLLMLFALHVCASIYLPSVYFPVEIAHVEIYQKMQATGQWLIPPASEAFGAVLPGYYWFMALVDMLPLPEGIFLPVLSALAALIALCGIYALGVCTQVGRHATLGGGLLLLSCPLFLIFMHMVGPEMLTAGFFSLSVALLGRGWTKDNAPFSFIFGFFFLALATFTGGFFPLWTALIASILLILWRGTLHRAHQLDAVIGFGVLVLSFALWLVISILGSEHASALDAIMLTAITPFMPPYWPVALPWALVFLACGLIPWILLPLFASWFRVLGSSWSNLKASRKENSGPTWMYLITIIALGLVVYQKEDALFSAVFLLPVLGVILAKTACNLSRLGSNVFFLLLAVILLACGLVITLMSIPYTAPYWTPYLSEDMARMLSAIKGLPLLSAVFILTALLLVRFTKRAFSEGGLVVMAFFAMFMVQPMTLFVAPSLVGHGAMQHPMGAGLGTLPLSIAPHMPTHPVGHFPVAPLEGEGEGQEESIPENTEPTPVLRAPEPASETLPEQGSEQASEQSPEQTPETATDATPVQDTPSDSTQPQVQPSLGEENAPAPSAQTPVQEPAQAPAQTQEEPVDPALPVVPATPTADDSITTL